MRKFACQKVHTNFNDLYDFQTASMYFLFNNVSYTVVHMGYILNRDTNYLITNELRFM